MFFANFNAKELSALAATLEISGRSKMKKQELYDAISTVINAAHDEAHRENWQYETVTAAGKTMDTHLAKFSGAVLPREEQERGWNFLCPSEVDPAWQVPYTLSDFLAPGARRLPRKLKKELRKASLI